MSERAATSNSQPIAELRSVYKSFPGTTVLSDFNLKVYEGEFLTLLGPSGCGKTTILRLIAGFETPDRGEVLIDGRVVDDLPPHQREVNTVFQSYALFPHMTVFDNVAFGLKMKKLPKDEIASRTREALGMVRLEGYDHRRPHQLSGGEQQRVALARAVVNRPKILLLDESLNALDHALRKNMQIELRQLHRRLGITFIFVTHDQEEALSMSDRMVLIRQGRIEQVGTPREVYESPANLFVATFVGEANIFDAVVIEPGLSGNTLASIANQGHHLKTDLQLSVGQRIKVVLRPEDMRMDAETDAADASSSFGFSGRVVERTYKGMTLDCVVELDMGQTVLVREFFDENDPSFDHPLGERVRVAWVPSWEHVIADE